MSQIIGIKTEINQEEVERASKKIITDGNIKGKGSMVNTHTSKSAKKAINIIKRICI